MNIKSLAATLMLVSVTASTIQPQAVGQSQGYVNHDGITEPASLGGTLAADEEAFFRLIYRAHVTAGRWNDLAHFHLARSLTEIDIRNLGNASRTSN